MGPTKQLKQIIQIEHNIIKNPNWPEANQLAIYKSGQRIWSRGHCETNPASGKSRTWTQDHLTARSMHWPLSHAASSIW